MADFFTGMRIASSGMTAQRTRLNTISSNIADINTTSTPEGGAYRRKDVVFEAMPDARDYSNILPVQGVDILSWNEVFEPHYKFFQEPDQ